MLSYRGSLSSCNYTCDYCPFAKTNNSRAELAADQKELERFSAWTSQQKRKLGILFTPWGEALIRSYYQEALVQLSYLEHVEKVAIQTNLSGSISFLKRAKPGKIGIWSTFHPDQTRLQPFLEKARQVQELGFPISIGIVGLREHFEVIQELKTSLNGSIYLWVNAYKKRPHYYSQEEVAWLREIDPYFPWNLSDFPSLGKLCATPSGAFLVNGKGDIQRCHFVDSHLGNIFDPEFQFFQEDQPCPNQTCRCHIGKIHGQRDLATLLFGLGILERVPETVFNFDQLVTPV